MQIGNSKRAARHLREMDDNLSNKHNIRVSATTHLVANGLVVKHRISSILCHTLEKLKETR